MFFARSTVVELCKRFGAMLKLPPGIDGAQLLWALAGKESSFGADSNPRHEPAYCHGGHAFNAERTKLWGCWAHCSYGPWQVMYANVSLGISPARFGQSPDLVAEAAVTLIQDAVNRQKAQTLEEIAEAYNLGHIAPDPEYVAKLQQCWEVPIGALA